jgi:hypothetical protein
MFRAFSAVLRREEAQDLADFCLLTALVALVAAGILLRISGGIESFWSVAQQDLQKGHAAAGKTPGASSAPR